MTAPSAEKSRSRTKSKPKDFISYANQYRKASDLHLNVDNHPRKNYTPQKEEKPGKPKWKTFGIKKDLFANITQERTETKSAKKKAK